VLSSSNKQLGRAEILALIDSALAETQE